MASEIQASLGIFDEGETHFGFDRLTTAKRALLLLLRKGTTRMKIFSATMT